MVKKAIRNIDDIDVIELFGSRLSLICKASFIKSKFQQKVSKQIFKAGSRLGARSGCEHFEKSDPDLDKSVRIRKTDKYYFAPSSAYVPLLPPL
jgi:hypothetical protein